MIDVSPKTGKNSGFTLIELLVVISIISLLSSIILVSLSAARDQAYYARAAEELKSMQNAVELYYSNYGTYPPIPGTCTYNGTAYNGAKFDNNLTTCWADLGTELKNYLPQIPVPNPLFLAEQPLARYSYWTFGAIPVNDSVTSQQKCVTFPNGVGNGYYIVFSMPYQNSFTTSSGMDNDSIDILGGDYKVLNGSCP